MSKNNKTLENSISEVKDTNLKNKENKNITSKSKSTTKKSTNLDSNNKINKSNEDKSKTTKPNNTTKKTKNVDTDSDKKSNIADNNVEKEKKLQQDKTKENSNLVENNIDVEKINNNKDAKDNLDNNKKKLKAEKTLKNPRKAYKKQHKKEKKLKKSIRKLRKKVVKAKSKNQDVSTLRRHIKLRANVVNILLVLVMGLSSGLLFGNWYVYANYNDTPNYDISSEMLSDDVNKIISNVIGIDESNDQDLKNWVSIAKNKKITPSKLTPNQNFQLTMYNLKQLDAYQVTTDALLETIVDQPLHSNRCLKDGVYYFENISKSSLVEVAEIAVWEKGSDTVTMAEGKDVNSTSANWEKGKHSQVSAESYKNDYGSLPDSVIIYVISSKTIIKSSQVTKKTDSNGKDLYEFTLQLDPIKSVVNYVKQVKKTSGLNDYPVFSDITLTITIDEDWNFNKIHIFENYKIKYGPITPKCKCNLDMIFQLDDNFEAPKY